MITKRILIAFSLAGLLTTGLLTACGGPGENAEIPEAQPAGATSADIGDHEVHFAALMTDQLPLEFARLHNITRSDSLAMLNVSVVRKSDGVPVSADVSVNIKNLTGQLKDDTVRRIEEPAKDDIPAGIYYVAITSIEHRETLVYDISVKPEGADSASSVRFKREYYTN